MASINYATREISCKIVYYGPGLSGKTTNLQIIHRKIPDKDKSEMVSLATETDRTLFFDFLPLDLGSIKGFATKFQLYTVPGQVYYNATRKLVLRGVDGVVFVVDSQVDKLQENLESFQNLQENLREYGHSIETIPVVLQFNKRDLPNVYPVDQLNALVNKYGMPYQEAVAATGVGVFTTLKAIGKAVIDKFNAKYSGFQGSRRPAGSPAAAPGAVPPPPRPAMPAAPPPQAPRPTSPGFAQGGQAPQSFGIPGGMPGGNPGGMPGQAMPGHGMPGQPQRPAPAPLTQSPGPGMGGQGGFAPFQTPSANPFQAPANNPFNAPQGNAPLGNAPTPNPPFGGPAGQPGGMPPGRPLGGAPMGGQSPFGGGGSPSPFAGAPGNPGGQFIPPTGGNKPPPSPFAAPAPTTSPFFTPPGAPSASPMAPPPAPPPGSSPFGAQPASPMGGPMSGLGGNAGFGGNSGFGGNAAPAANPFGSPSPNPFGGGMGGGMGGGLGGGGLGGGGFGGPSNPSPFNAPQNQAPQQPGAQPPFGGLGNLGNKPGGAPMPPPMGNPMGNMPGGIQHSPMAGLSMGQPNQGEQQPFGMPGSMNPPGGFGSQAPMSAPPSQPGQGGNFGGGFGAPNMPSSFPQPSAFPGMGGGPSPMPPLGDAQGGDDHGGIVSTYEDMQRDDSFKTRKLPLPGEKKKGFFDGLFKKDK